MLLIPILAVSLLIVIIYIAGRLTNVIDPPQDMMHAGIEMVWRHLPHRYVYWDHCDRCYGRWESTEVPETAADLDWEAWEEAEARRERGEYLTTTPGTSMEIVNDGTVIFDGPGNYHLEIAAEVNHADSLSELEWRAMLLRANSPHLFRDDWYEQSRKDFSHWSVDQWRLADNYQREMGIGAYAA